MKSLNLNTWEPIPREYGTCPCCDGALYGIIGREKIYGVDKGFAAYNVTCNRCHSKSTEYPFIIGVRFPDEKSIDRKKAVEQFKHDVRRFIFMTEEEEE